MQCYNDKGNTWLRVSNINFVLKKLAETKQQRLINFSAIKESKKRQDAP